MNIGFVDAPAMTFLYYFVLVEIKDPFVGSVMLVKERKYSDIIIISVEAGIYRESEQHS